MRSGKNEAIMNILQRRLPDIRWGVQYGMGFAILFSAYAVIARITAGPTAFDRYHATLVSVVGIYFGGGLVSGTIVGLLRPLAKYAFGAALVGFLAALPITLAIDRLTDDGASWNYIDTVVVVVTSAGLGSLPALIWLQQSVNAKSKAGAPRPDPTADQSSQDGQ
jgi:hypothetical protein